MIAYLWRIAVYFLTVKGFTSAFLLTTSSDRATTGNEFNFTCNLAKDANGIISIVRDHTDECIIDVDRSCRLQNCNPNYVYSCNGSTICLTIPVKFDIDSLHGSRWKCHNILREIYSNEVLLYVNVPITQANLTPIPYDFNPTKIISGSSQSFKCTTDAGRPSSRIQWYLSGSKISDNASVQTDTCNFGCNGKVISSSVLLYTGNTTDNKKSIYCSAVNIKGEGVQSHYRVIEILFEPVILNIQDINITEGSSLKITATFYANPTSVYVWWTRQNDTAFRYFGTTLFIRNILRYSSGNYTTCHAMNTLTASGHLPQNRTSKETFYVNVQLSPSDESMNGAAIGVLTGFAVIVFTLGVTSLFVFMHRKRRMFKKREDSNNIVYESTFGELRQTAQSDQHLYNALQDYKTDDDYQQNRASKSSSTYEEFGEVKSNNTVYANKTMNNTAELHRKDMDTDVYVNTELKPSTKT